MKQQAKKFAEMAHAGQTRKNSDTPYVTHPIRVAERLEKNAYSTELICAGYLHDVVEDTLYEIEDIEREFGDRVAALVATHTEDKSKSWQERKQHTIDTIRYAEKEIKYLIIADKLDNLLGMEIDLKQQGDAAWDKFNAGFEKQMWYNRSVVANMYVGLDDRDIPNYFRDYADVVERVFG
ncbi:(p)ppGpp synthase/HD superfamily hydrolase [Virgibacillus natechei]|uniref:(P)ppGpp synthase/HD superfamily hydrolase n=1 Tax=Virgibacillus natechei TaxID=1216297 RepID=A0ABS4ID01_9BACI|nr:HD domain-containing protein [Virgibacillus natechei]MBP1968525.1 (p)ppGpp synthase/HD superfamily hydrolase [Virgibacillus natechei]UZD13640.1 HD domain-containing protein [Virgibacillus natechei]